jgi:hypothetical protein
MGEKKKTEVDLAFDAKITEIDKDIKKKKLSTLDGYFDFYEDDILDASADDAATGASLQAKIEERRKKAAPLSAMLSKGYGIALTEYGDDGYLTDANLVKCSRVAFERLGYEYDEVKKRWKTDGLNKEPSDGSKLSIRALNVLRTTLANVHAKACADHWSSEVRADNYVKKCKASIAKLDDETRRLIFWKLLPSLLADGTLEMGKLFEFTTTSASTIGDNPNVMKTK